MLIGYACVSEQNRDLDPQVNALEKVGCERLFTDPASAAEIGRPGLERALSSARKGDTVVVWKLEHLGHSLRHLIETVNDLGERGIGFRSLRENIDTTSSGGKPVLRVFAALAEIERDTILEQPQARRSAARARGRAGGRPRALDEEKRNQAVMLHNDPSNSIADICRELNISRATLYRYLAATQSAAG